MDLKNVKNILFDLGGVLINLDKSRCLEEFRKIRVENIDSQIGNSFKSGLFFKLEEGRISPADFRDEIRKISSVFLSDEEIDFAWNSFLQEIPRKKLTLLRRLRKEYRVFMLSNTNEIHFEFMREHCFDKENGYIMNDYFEKCYLSYELHLSKPDKEIFEAVVSDAGIIPAESLFIDDNSLNIACAEKLGFNTYLAIEREDFSDLFHQPSCE